MGLQGVFAAMLTVATVVSAASSRLDIIDLPTGFFPEGITLAEEWTVYVGSFADAGSIWKGDLSTGEGQVVIADAGSHALGLDYDRRSGYLFVCGGYAGTARVYDTSDFSLIADITLTGTDGTSLVNDVIVTETAAYFTDSLQAQLYSIPLQKYSGKLEDGADTVGATIPLGSEFTMLDGTVNANGIEITDDGETLIVVNMASGELFTVDPVSGEAAKIDLDGVLVHGDGLVLRQNTLWVVENTVAAGENSHITEVSLSADLTCGSVLPRVLGNDNFDYPATTVRKGNSFYTVMSKFGVAEEDVSTTSYEIVRTDRDSGVYACPASSDE
eukprot:jgi/Undpi1/10512/HiC_scaffold_29.g12962.m1